MLVAFALAAILTWFLVSGPSNDGGGGIAGEAANPDLVASTTGTSATAVQDYVQFADAVGKPGIEESTIAPMTVAEGLRSLAGALAVLDLGTLNLPVDLRVTAEHVLLNPTSPATAETVRTVLIEAAAAIGEQHQNAAASLRQSADALETNTPLTSQPATLREFFRRSAQALKPPSEDGSPRSAATVESIAK